MLERLIVYMESSLGVEQIKEEETTGDFWGFIKRMFMPNNI